VSVSLSALHIRVVVLDIEGTTTPVDFVYQVLFPYARAHVPAFLSREWDNAACREVVALLGLERAADIAAGRLALNVGAQDFGPADVVAYVRRPQGASRVDLAGWLPQRRASRLSLS